LIALPADIVEIRRTDPELNNQWRSQVRVAFQEALSSGKKVIGFSAHNEYVLE